MKLSSKHQSAPKLGTAPASEHVTSYSVEELLDSGLCIKVTSWVTREMGFVADEEGRFRITAVMTVRLWRTLHQIPNELSYFQTVRGRGHDVLWLAGWELRRARRHGLDHAQFLIPLPTGEEDEDAKLLRVQQALDATGRPHVVVGLAEEFPIV